MKKISSIFLAMICCCIMVLPAYAAEPQTEELLRTDPYYFWRVEDTTPISNSYGTWQYGPSLNGPGTLSMELGKETSVSCTITGSYKNLGNIEAALDISFTKGSWKASSASYEVPAGQHWQIKYRPIYVTVRVTERQYMHMDGSDYPTTTTALSTVTMLQDWDFVYRVL